MSERVEPNPARVHPGVALSAVAHGFTAGCLAALALEAMHAVQHLVWHGDAGTARIFLTVLIGGCLIAALRLRTEGTTDLDDILEAAQNPATLHWRRAAHLLALSAVAVGFGGAVGPEAGLIAIVGELGALVTRRLEISQAQVRAIGEYGVAAALSGLYGSPPGGAAWSDDTLGGRKALNLVAAVTGLIGFLAVHRAFTDEPVNMGIPTPSGGTDQILFALVPALASGLLAAAFALIPPALLAQVRRLGGPATQTLAMTLPLAALAAMEPIVRFSGQESLPRIPQWVADGAWITLAALAALKLLATSLSLAGGWLGGAIFPLVFAGAAMGAATTGLVSALDPGTAVVAGLTSAAVIGLRKPLAALLICAFVVGGGGWGALCVGAAVGTLIARLLPEQPAH